MSKMTEQEIEEVQQLRDQIAKLKEALIWCSGSADFGDGGQAREGWLKVCEPLLHDLSSTQVEDATYSGMLCYSCGYTGIITTYKPSVNIPNNVNCPMCGSTSNKHNKIIYMQECRSLKNE